jgi:hypothetical protein
MTGSGRGCCVLGSLHCCSRHRALHDVRDPSPLDLALIRESVGDQKNGAPDFGALDQVLGVINGLLSQRFGGVVIKSR